MDTVGSDGTQLQTSGFREYKASHIHASKKAEMRPRARYTRERERQHGRGQKVIAMTAIWMATKQKRETFSQSKEYCAFFPASGDPVYSIFKLMIMLLFLDENLQEEIDGIRDSKQIGNIKLEKSENLAPHIVSHNQRMGENCFDNAAKHRFPGSFIIVKKESRSGSCASLRFSLN